MTIDHLADFYHREQHALVRFAATIVGPDRADDVVANAMVSVMKRFSGGPTLDRSAAPPDSLRPYVYKAVANAGAKEWRTLGRRRHREALAVRLHTPPTATAPNDDGGATTSAEITDALARLSPRQRAVIHLAYWEDLTPSVIASRLMISEGSVRRHLARARNKLRSTIRPLAREHGDTSPSVVGGTR